MLVVDVDMNVKLLEEGKCAQPFSTQDLWRTMPFNLLITVFLLIAVNEFEEGRGESVYPFVRFLYKTIEKECHERVN